MRTRDTDVECLDRYCKMEIEAGELSKNKDSLIQKVKDR